VSKPGKIVSGKTDPHIAGRADSADAGSLHRSAITSSEPERGILPMKRHNARRNAKLRSWLDARVLSEVAGRFCPVDTAVAQRCVRLQVPDTRAGRVDSGDGAGAWDDPHYQRNLADLAPTGIKLLNLWEGAA
jgi:hypothetical protein